MENLGHVDHHGKVRKIDIEAVVSRLSYSDWLILYYLAQVRKIASCQLRKLLFLLSFLGDGKGQLWSPDGQIGRRFARLSLQR